MQNTPQDHSFVFETQPSFVFEPAYTNYFQQLEPELDKLHLDNKRQPAQPSSRVCKFHQRKIKRLQQRIKDLELQVKQLKKEKSSNQTQNPVTQASQTPALFQKTETPKPTDPTADCLANIQQQQEAIVDILSHQKLENTAGSLEFEQFQITPQPPAQEELQLNGQTWIVMGMLMMVMGININGYDGSIDAYKITRQTVDSIRKQVQKSAEQIVFPVFYSKLFNIEGSAGMESSPIDGCFQLQGLRLESINQQDLMFEEHLNFRLKYQALIVMMEYMKQYASLA